MVRTIIVDVWMQHPGRAFLRCSARVSLAGHRRRSKGPPGDLVARDCCCARNGTLGGRGGGMVRSLDEVWAQPTPGVVGGLWGGGPDS